jgi:SGNH hydrolase-like domain, acetyltransferase AlgX
MDAAAQRLAQRIGMSGETKFATRSVKLDRHGDLVQMLQSRVIDSMLPPEPVETTQIIGTNTKGATVLVLGDSFSRIFQNDEPRDAGFIAQLASHLGQPVASLVNDGGASTLVRQELFRHPEMLTNIKVVVWEFTERDLRLGIEGWQIVPLPPVTQTNTHEAPIR